MTPRALLPSLLLGIALVLPGMAGASAPRVALIVTGPLDDEAALLEARLRAELLISGFEVLTVSRSGPVGQAELARIADESGSSAAVSIVRSEQWLSAEVWLSRSRGGGSVLQQVRPEPISRDAPAIVAIRAAEILRASAIDLREPATSSSSPAALASSSSPAVASSPAPPLAPASAAPPSPALPLVDRGETPRADDAPRVFALTAALSALGGPGGVPGGFGPTLAASWSFAEAWSVEGRGTGPISSSVAFDDGSVDVDQELLALALRLDIDAGAQLTPFVLAGGGAHRTGVRGRTTPPREALRDSAWTAVALLETGLRLRASPRWSVRSGIGASYAASRPVIAVDDRVLAHAGRPGFHGMLGLELGW